MRRMLWTRQIWALSLLCAALVVAAAPVASHAAGRAGTPLMQGSSRRIAFSRRDNVYLMSADGSGQQRISRYGIGNPLDRTYPWYQWSPDGRYLLVVRIANRADTAWTLLLLDAHGALLRTLASAAPVADFYPSWAIDGDQVAYLASIADVSTPTSIPTRRMTVDHVDASGASVPLWSYTVQGGGGGPEGAGCFSPSEFLYWSETGPAGIAASLQWGIAGHSAVYGPASFGGLRATDTRTGATRDLVLLGDRLPVEAALSPSGTLAAVVGIGQRVPRVILTGLQPGAAVQTVAPGELPAWSADGRFLYFVQRTQSGTVPYTCPDYGTAALPAYTSVLWRANADGSHLVRLMSEDAYALGRPQPTSDGRSVVFSRIDNPRRNVTVQVQRLDLAGGQAVTLAQDAGRPQVQP